MVEIHEDEQMDLLSTDQMSGGSEEEKEDISYADLKKRMWMDQIRMKKFKAERQAADEKASSDDVCDTPAGSNNSTSTVASKEEKSRRKKMLRSQDAILKYMVKIMEICNAQGFVYGIIPEIGKAVTGSK